MKLIKFTSIFIVFAILSTACSSSKENKITSTNFMLNTAITIIIYDYEDNQIFQEVYQLIDSYEKVLSVDIEGSDLDFLKQNSGKDYINVSPDTYYLLQESIKYSQISDGDFDITVALISSLWNFGKENQQVPEKSQIEKLLPLVDYKEISLKDNNQARLNKTGMKAALGAIAKGYIADKVKDFLISKGIKSAIINLGGNVLLVGNKPEGQAFNVGVQNPMDKSGNYMGFIKAVDKSIVSSGTYERFFVEDGVSYHHILNPKTGYPENNGLLQTTIISDKSVDGDGLSTTVFLMGLDRGMELIESLDNVEAIFVTADKKIHMSSGADNYFSLTNNDFSVIN